MTRQHALRRLLAHGALARVEITGWPADGVDHAIAHAVAVGAVAVILPSGEGRTNPRAWCRRRYALRTWAGSKD